MAFCRECGVDVGSAKFCPVCGARQGGEVAKKPAEKSVHGNIIGFVALLILAVLIFLAFGLSPDTSTTTAPSATFTPRATSRPASSGVPAGSHYITYRVEGTAHTVDLTYNNASGNTEQKDDVRLPWQMTFTVPRGEFLYVSAQNQGTTGSVKCVILVDGLPAERAESSGEYVIATCSGSAE